MRAFITAGSRKRIGARIGAYYSIPKDTLDEESLQKERDRLTLQPRASFGKPPPAFAVYREDDTYIHVPRFYGLDRFGDAEIDERVDGDDIPHLEFNGYMSL